MEQMGRKRCGYKSGGGLYWRSTGERQAGETGDVGCVRGLVSKRAERVRGCGRYTD